MLAGLRGLRGGAFDVFGWTTERRMERQLIADFEQLVGDVLPRLDGGNLRNMTAIVEQYMDVRGFGPVKEEAVEKVRSEVQQRITAL